MRNLSIQENPRPKGVIGWIRLQPSLKLHSLRAEGVTVSSPSAYAEKDSVCVVEAQMYFWVCL